MQNFFSLFPFLSVLLLFFFPKSRSIYIFLLTLGLALLSVLIGIRLELFYLSLSYIFLFLIVGFYPFSLEREIDKSKRDNIERKTALQKEIEKNKILFDEWNRNCKKLNDQMEEISKRYSFGESLVRNLEEKPILEEFFKTISKKKVQAFSFFKLNEKKWDLVFCQGSYGEEKWKTTMEKVGMDEKSLKQAPYILIPLAGSENQTLVLAPVRLHGEDWGMIDFVFDNPVPKYFPEEIPTYAQLLGMGLQKVSLYQAVLERSRKDGLTQLYLRRVFMERTQEEVGFSKRYNTSFSLLMLDLDHFKKVNDTYGHPAGDLVLKTVADCLKSVLHTGVMICRYGGEEFSILIGLSPIEQVLQDAEKIRKAVSEIDIPIHGKGKPGIKITVSIGVAHYLPDCPTIEELIKRSDVSLYQAKKEGRNRVVQWQNKQ